MTQAGIILGTAAYMSPEQAKGKLVNRRTDLWAFGCVLFEMLTGARAFGGEDVTDTLAKIVMGEPAWSLLPASTPSTIHRLLRRCLQKDAHRRLDSASVARLEIESASLEETATAPVIAVPSSQRWKWTGWIAAGISSAAVVVLIVWPRTPQPPSFSLEVPTPGLSLGTGQSFFAVSPDGSLIAMRTIENDQPVLSLRRLDRFDSNTVRATTSASWPFWSPDSRLVAYFVNSRLQLSPVDGGPPQVVPGVTTTVNLTQGTWNADGVILYTALEQGIMRTSITGATPVAVTSIDKANGEHSHLFPRFLPDGGHFLYLAASATQTPSILVGSLDGTPPQRLVSANGHAEFAPPDWLLYVRDGTLMAQRFDVKRLTLVGEPVPLVNDIYMSTANSLAGFSLSRTGVLVYRPGGAAGRQLQWVDRSGNVLSRIGSAGEFRNVSLSPDGRVMAVHRPDNGGDIWLTDLERGTETRFTVDPAIDDNPVWTPDGKRVAFVSNRDGGIFNIYLKSAGGIGTEELLLKTVAHKRLGGWTPDGAYLLYDEVGEQTNRDIWMMPMAGRRQPIKVIGGPFNEDEPSVSPDGRWIAYSSDESGTYQIYVQAFPKGDRKWRVSSAPTTVRHPRWSRDGKELFFDVTGRMAVVRMTPSPDGIVAGAEQRLFFGLLNLPPHNYDLGPDGTRILAILSPQGAGVEAPPLRVVTNWTRLLPK
jgi:Tol biopolymer transport system component